MPLVKVSSKSQISIPRRVREKLHIRPGQNLMLSERDGSVVLTPVPDDPIEYLCGIFKDGPSLTKELLEERARDLEIEERRAGPIR